MPAIQSIQQLEAAAGEWNALADGTGQALLRHEWFLCAARAFHQDSDLAVIAVTRNQRLAAIAPLARRAVNGVDRLGFLGANLHEPGGFLYEDDEAHRELLDRLLLLRRPLVLERMPAESFRLLTNGSSRGRRGIVMAKRTAPSFSLALRETNTAYFDQLPAKLRYDLKRARTRAEAEGDLALEVIAPCHGNVDAHFDRFVALEGSGWKSRRQSSLATAHRTRAFFRDYARRTATAGTLRFFFLRIGPTVAAVQMAVEVYERLWVLKIGYDESFARCSPGLLLMAKAVEYAIGRGLRSYEFLGVAEPWERRWRPFAREHGLVVFYPPTVKGWLGASCDLANTAWRKVSAVPRYADE